MHIYDNDSNLARGIVNGVVTFYPGRQTNREVDGANVTVKKFYTLGSSTVAVRTVQGRYDTLNWILGDHAKHPRRGLGVSIRHRDPQGGTSRL